MKDVLIALVAFSSLMMEAHASCNYRKEATNKKGERHGKILCFYDKELRTSTGFETYKDGRQHGQTLYLNHETAKPSYEANYLEGQQHGLWRRYSYTTGKPTEEENYKNGKRDGLQKYFYDTKEDSGLMRTNVYLAGEEIGPTTGFFPSGGRRSFEHIRNDLGEYRTSMEFYENGSLRRTKIYKGNSSEIAMVSYYVSGKIWKIYCNPPGFGYLYTLAECQKHFSISLESLGKRRL